MMKAKHCLLVLVLLLLSGCSQTVKNFIPPEQLAARSPEREQKALELFNKASQLQEEGKIKEAIHTYQVLAKNFAETCTAPKAYHHIARLQFSLGNFEEGIENLQIIAQHYSDYEDYPQVIQDQFVVAEKMMNSKRRGAWRWLPSFKDSASAVQFFHGVVSMAPGSDYAARALLCIAKLEREENHKVKAIEALDQLIENHPGHYLIPEAYYLLGNTYLSFVQSAQNDQGATDQAIHCFEDFLTLFETKDFVDAHLINLVKEDLKRARCMRAESRLVLGKFYQNKWHYAKGALVFYNEAQDLAPQTEIAEEAQKSIKSVEDGEAVPQTWADKVFGAYQYVAPKDRIRN